jgi:hypothetical protein
MACVYVLGAFRYIDAFEELHVTCNLAKLNREVELVSY